MEEIVLYKNLSDNNLSKQKKLSLLVIVLLEMTFGNNNFLFNKITDYLISSKLIDDDITSDEYFNARTKLFNLINNLNSPIPINDNCDPASQKLVSFNNTNLNAYNKTFYELDLLGSGSFGNVYKVQHKIDNELYAIKKVFITDDLIELNYDVFQEVKLFAKLSHPNIVRYYSSWVDIDINSILKYNLESEMDNLTSEGLTSINEKCPREGLTSINEKCPILFIQMELCDRTLKEYMENDIFSDPIERRIEIWNQILNGIKYLHINNIIHRDIKPSNIFFLNNQIKIGDFGLSKNLNTLILQTEKSIEIGYAYYRAPEIDSGNYGSEIDIYALGIILIEMLLDCKTIFEKNILLTKILKTRSLSSILITNKYNDLILQMINFNPELRPKIRDLKQINV
jgi:serine/threonine protein kinase